MFHALFHALSMLYPGTIRAPSMLYVTAARVGEKFLLEVLMLEIRSKYVGWTQGWYFYRWYEVMVALSAMFKVLTRTLLLSLLLLASSPTTEAQVFVSF
jgi:hypothetical protein